MNSQPNRSYMWLFWLLAIAGVAVDQASKYGIYTALYKGGPGENWVQLIPGAFRLTADYTDKSVPDNWLKPLRSISGDHMPHVNHGALFGLGGGEQYGNFLFSVISLLAATAIILWISRTAAGTDRLLCLSLGLILAGTIGNLYDRLVFDGVRDFLHWYFLVDQVMKGGWPIFNLADCCLVCGAGLLLYQAVFLQPNLIPEKSAAAGQESVPAEMLNVE